VATAGLHALMNSRDSLLSQVSCGAIRDRKGVAPQSSASSLTCQTRGVGRSLWTVEDFPGGPTRTLAILGPPGEHKHGAGPRLASSRSQLAIPLRRQDSVNRCGDILQVGTHPVSRRNRQPSSHHEKHATQWSVDAPDHRPRSWILATQRGIPQRSGGTSPSQSLRHCRRLSAALEN
jgi:hypothetical protein